MFTSALSFKRCMVWLPALNANRCVRLRKNRMRRRLPMPQNAGCVTGEYTTRLPTNRGVCRVSHDAILNREPPPVQERKPALPAELGHIIGNALEKDRRLRYQSAAELHADLQRLKRDSGADRSASAKHAQVATRPRRQAWLWIAAFYLLIVVGVTTVLFLRRHRDRTVREPVPTRVTSNGSDAPIEWMALSPDGKYLAYSDSNGVHVRSMQTGDSRVLSDTKDMTVLWWAADGTQFYAGRRTTRQILIYGLSPAGGTPHLLGNSIPSPSGKYSVIISGFTWVGSDANAMARCGYLVPVARGDQTALVCNECNAVVKAVENAEVEQALSEVLMSQPMCSARCTHCGALNVFPGFSAMLAFICSECGEGVSYRLGRRELHQYQ
jgi:hypothetical protein